MPERKLYLGPLTDNRRWDRITIRADDVIVVTPPKSGTTWMQTIIALLFSGDPDVETDLSGKMPWVDIRLRDLDEVAARIEGMTERRCLKSHTPMDGLPLDHAAQYICVFRHPLDAHFSYRRHMNNTPLGWFDHWYPEDDPEGVGLRRFLDGGPEGFDGDAMTLAHILRHYQAALALTDRPNVTLFHYADMCRDLPGTIEKLSDHLGCAHPPDVMEAFAKVASFDHMRAHAERFAPGGGTGFYKSDQAFFHSGTSGGWKSHLTKAELAAYDAVMAAALRPAERAWLENGSGGSPQ